MTMTLSEAREAFKMHKRNREDYQAARAAQESLYRLYWVNPIHALFHKLPTFTVPVDRFTEWALIDHNFSMAQVIACERDITSKGRGFLETSFTYYIVEREPITESI